MILSSRFIDLLECEFPLEMAMADDPVGVQVLAEDRPLELVAVAYEINEAIVRRADEAGAGMIVAFHPLIYPSVRRIAGGSRVERTIVELIQRRIGLYIVHTAFDAHPEGTSRALGMRLGLASLAPLVADPRRSDWGMGAVGELAHAMELDEFVSLLQGATGAMGVRVSQRHDAQSPKKVRRVAILGGSGMSFYQEAIRSKADIFVTADVRYHGFHEANDAIPIADPGHAESECLVVESLSEVITRVVTSNRAELQLMAINDPTNPVRLMV